jgi:endonuclease YncB( thermonuclease family)
MRPVLLAFALALMLSAVALGSASAADERDRVPTGATAAEVVRIFDGDTVEVRVIQPNHPDRGRTRLVDLLGVDAPSPAPAGTRVNCLEVVSAWGAAGLLPKDHLVWLEADAAIADRPDRWDRYVWVVHRDSAEPILANEAMIARGFARVVDDPASPYAERMARAQIGAIAEQRGLWGGCGDEVTPVRLGFARGGLPAVQDTDCASFDSQAEAQEVYDADPSDPNNLDEDGDGLACDEFDYGDGVVVPDEEQDDPSLDLTCEDFATQEEAQEQLDADPTDPLGLDPDGDGTACEADESVGGTIDTVTPSGVGTAYRPSRSATPLLLIAFAATLAGTGLWTRRKPA